MQLLVWTFGTNKQQNDLKNYMQLVYSSILRYCPEKLKQEL
jgi:hypothetical protein